MAIAHNKIYADVLVIGSGLAGLLLSLKLAECEDLALVIASKGALCDSNSTFAQGGLAAVTDGNAFDSPAVHLEDTIKSGAGLIDVAAARGIIYGGERLVAELGDLGVSFDRKANGTFEVALEGGHSQSRVLHNKDATGKEITTVLAERIREIAACRPDVKILEYAFANELLTENGSCIGAQLEIEGETVSVIAPHTVLATGGIGQVFQRTTNPAVATGDGIALAYRAGAKLMDMEFVQFHPTALCKDGAPPFLISEAVRGAGAILTDINGKRFVKRFHQDGELATRDIVARSIHTVMHEYGTPSVNLDLRPIGSAKIAAKFPTILKRCAEYGIDILNEPVPVAPAAHYFMGGVSADIDGSTSVPGLYAIGETACTGLHGANRLASNSLLEAGVMALRLADYLLSPRHCLATSRHAGLAVPEPTPYIVPEDLAHFRSQMYRHAGLVRSETGLAVLLSDMHRRSRQSADKADAVARNMFDVGRLVAQAALLRKESRGAHFREDYSTTDSAMFGRRLWLSRSGYGWAVPSHEEVAIHRQAARSA